ncbi:MAG: GNAT family N-acetyltransferase [Sulfitobacter sp.]|nr:GNAT family N-acetyltransferase [Sulfitobacter sp.]
MSTGCRVLKPDDYVDARTLYETLSAGRTLPEFDIGRAGFERVIGHDGTWIIGAERGGRIVSFATLHVLPNMTYQMRPYALIENVATLPDFQRRGIGRTVMAAATRKAWAEKAYKIMVLTNHARQTRGFYEKLGFVSGEKDGMILRPDAQPT